MALVRTQFKTEAVGSIKKGLPLQLHLLQKLKALAGKAMSFPTVAPPGRMPVHDPSFLTHTGAFLLFFCVSLDRNLWAKNL